MHGGRENFPLIVDFFGIKKQNETTIFWTKFKKRNWKDKFSIAIILIRIEAPHNPRIEGAKSSSRS